MSPSSNRRSSNNGSILLVAAAASLTIAGASAAWYYYNYVYDPKKTTTTSDDTTVTASNQSSKRHQRQQQLKDYDEVSSLGSHGVSEHRVIDVDNWWDPSNHDKPNGEGEPMTKVADKAQKEDDPTNDKVMVRSRGLADLEQSEMESASAALGTTTATCSTDQVSTEITTSQQGQPKEKREATDHRDNLFDQVKANFLKFLGDDSHHQEEKKQDEDEETTTKTAKDALKVENDRIGQAQPPPSPEKSNEEKLPSKQERTVNKTIPEQPQSLEESKMLVATATNTTATLNIATNASHPQTKEATTTNIATTANHPQPKEATSDNNDKTNDNNANILDQVKSHFLTIFGGDNPKKPNATTTTSRSNHDAPSVATAETSVTDELEEEVEHDDQEEGAIAAKEASSPYSSKSSPRRRIFASQVARTYLG